MSPPPMASPSPTPGRRIPAVGALARDAQGRILLVLRGNEPDRDHWSLPGGRVEPGEDAGSAIVREMREETGLVVDVERLLGRIERSHPEGGVYVIDDFAVTIIDGVLQADSDAQDAQWFTAAEVTQLPVTPGLLDHLAEWGALDPRTKSAP